MAKKKVLIVDDEPTIRFAVRDFLEHSGYEVVDAGDRHTALLVFRESRPDAVILDYQLPDGTALDLLPLIRRINSSVPIIVLTAHGSIDLAVRAIKEGAEQFFTKPVELPALALILERLLRNQRNRQIYQISESRAKRESVDPFNGLSPAIHELKSLAHKIVGSDSPVLITGETGTGKGVLARWLHARGPRAEEAFVDINCAGLSTELLDSELFGHERGAFTGAVREKPGLLEVAHGGTVFLDEIGDMDIAVQGKLLKVLEEQRFRRVGDVRDRSVNVRLIAATHHDLTNRVESGGFRRDLFYRINTLHLVVPALRDRPEDIVPLARSLLARLASDMGHQTVELDPSAEAALMAYPWPGNIREVRNVLERSLLLSEGNRLTQSDLRLATPNPELSPSATAITLRGMEVAHIRQALRAVGGRVPAAALRLDVPKSSLYQKLKTLGIDPSEFQT
jgi:DNA-binding NtrC family response regulator